MISEAALKNGIESMKKMKNQLENEMFDLRSHLAEQAFDLTAAELAAQVARIAELEKRIEAGKAKIALAEAIAR